MASGCRGVGVIVGDGESVDNGDGVSVAAGVIVGDGAGEGQAVAVSLAGACGVASIMAGVEAESGVLTTAGRSAQAAGSRASSVRMRSLVAIK